MDNPPLLFFNRIYGRATAATGQLLADLAEGLAARGWPVRVVTATAPDRDDAGVEVIRVGPGGRARVSPGAARRPPGTDVSGEPGDVSGEPVMSAAGGDNCS